MFVVNPVDLQTKKYVNHNFTVKYKTKPQKLNQTIARYNIMMSSTDTRTGDDTCPICKRPKSKHTSDEIRACTKKMNDLNSTDTDGL